MIDIRGRMDSMIDSMRLLEQMSLGISQTYAQIFDEQIYKIFGASPNPEEVARRGMIFKLQDEEGHFYDEFRLDGIPYFQQRVKIEEGKISIEIKRC